jgi:hypothetical protein
VSAAILFDGGCSSAALSPLLIVKQTTSLSLSLFVHPPIMQPNNMLRRFPRRHWTPSQLLRPHRCWGTTTTHSRCRSALRALIRESGHCGSVGSRPAFVDEGGDSRRRRRTTRVRRQSGEAARKHSASINFVCVDPAQMSLS